MSDLKTLISKRKVIRKKVTDIYNRIESFSTLSAGQKISERSVLLSHKRLLIDLNDEIFSLRISDVEFSEDARESEIATCIEYFDRIEYCIPHLEVASAPGTVEVAKSLLKQPTAPLPKFNSTDGEDFIRFISEFESTTQSFSYPDRDLLLLLRQQVEGRAKVLLNSLEADKQTYKDAKDLLKLAFASEVVRKTSTIKTLTSLRLGESDDPFKFISILRTVVESVKTLKITPDDFIQYFMWNGLNDKFKRELVQITTKTYPSVQEIMDNFFIACERYENCLKSEVSLRTLQSSVRQKTTSLAIKTLPEVRRFYCTLCVEGENNHSIFKCKRYDTPEAKLQRLKILKGCFRCGNLNHMSRQCRFEFRQKCVKCSGLHFHCLCSKSSKVKLSPPEGKHKEGTPIHSGKADVKREASINEVNSSIAVLPSIVNKTVLPSFSFTVPGVDGIFRGLKDSCSQSSFVTESLLNKCSLPVLEPSVKLTVNGFNGSKEYISRLIQLPMKFGNCISNVPALVVPSINIKLNLPGLGKIVESFENKGFILADKKLCKDSDSIDNVQVLLGSDAHYALMGKDVAFGCNPPSVYTESQHGILLMGNLENLSKNIKFLGLPNICNERLEVINPLRSSRTDFSSCSQITTCSFLCKIQIDPLLDDEVCDLHYKELEVGSNIAVLDDKGQIVESKLLKATDEVLEHECRRFLNLDANSAESIMSETNQNWVNFALSNFSREKDGRLIVPLLWNSKIAHRLSTNENLSRLILKANLKKLRKKDGHLQLVDQVIRDQLKDGVIEKISDLDSFKAEHPNYSFLPHMAVFRPEKETTKCRIVFLSNLKETVKVKCGFSHNQCIDPGPNLNQKLSSAFLHLRFDKLLLTYDLKKAFNMLSLNNNDQARLLFFWFKNVQKNDYSLVAYKNVRLSFGLRCSPFLLMLALYYILVHQYEPDPQLRNLKLLLYSLFYMDNGAVGSADSQYLKWACSQLPYIFNPYKFEIQQLVTNDVTLQAEIDAKFEINTPVENSLFGIVWNRADDVIYTKEFSLNPDADTKRKVLQTIASNFDVFGFNIPVFNRSRLYMHRLQCSKELAWDQVLSPSLQREWRNICRQANGSQPVKVQRFIGQRNGKFRLKAFTDASRDFYGTVVYIEDIDSGEISFLQAKNRLINKLLKGKSVPALELNAISLGVETLMEIYRDLADPSCVKSIDIDGLDLYCDSSCALQWLQASECTYSKMQKHSVFVQNRISNIRKLCEIKPVSFIFIAGKDNPADCVSRCLSPRLVSKSFFISGPEVVPGNEFLYFTVPSSNTNTLSISVAEQSAFPGEPLLEHEKYSTLEKLKLIYRRVMLCIDHWKRKAGVEVENLNNVNYSALALRKLILEDQQKHFMEIFSYFRLSSKPLKDIPPLVSQLNVFIDSDGILRVKSKFKKWYGHNKQFPILLYPKSYLTKLIIMDTHAKFLHGGCYSVLSELRKCFFIPKHFSVIKNAIKQCVSCHRFNTRSVRLNQNTYREFRSSPPAVPFSNIFVDFIGPFNVKQGAEKMKVWILCFTCTWSRAINLKICRDLSVNEYLRAFSLHVFEYGFPQLCVSDPGSQLVAGGNIITSFINDPDTKLYLESNGIKHVKFQQFFKGHSELGSLVESCVKLVKKLIFSAIKTWVLSLPDFEYLVCNVVHLANKRPIAFKESLRETEADSCPEPITPEMLVKGYELVSLNLIPDLQEVPDDPEWKMSSSPTEIIKDEYEKLRKVRYNLLEAYQNEFLSTLVAQAVDRKDRYRPVCHQKLGIGDIVLIKEPNTKTINFPLGIVKGIEENDLGETTGAIILKGKTRELIKRHVTTLIPYLKVVPDASYNSDNDDKQSSRKLSINES
ncbi:uncharacterized protein [Palaemon carinicauda]|uniref:uncharacterized protein n=1 Tax=Palaemon carinicauda TaxID=392227 RepID=UPI0035B5BA32